MKPTLGENVAAVHECEGVDLPCGQNTPYSSPSEIAFLWSFATDYTKPVTGEIDVGLAKDPIRFDDSWQIGDKEKGGDGNGNGNDGVDHEDPPPSRQSTFPLDPVSANFGTSCANSR